MKENSRCVVFIKVIPKAHSTEFVGIENEAYKIRISKAPENGEANLELIRFLSKELKISKSSIKILSGETSRKKKVEIEGLTIDQFKSNLKKILKNK